jgi:hypothetical protein
LRVKGIGRVIQTIGRMRGIVKQITYDRECGAKREFARNMRDSAVDKLQGARLGFLFV